MGLNSQSRLAVALAAGLLVAACSSRAADAAEDDPNCTQSTWANVSSDYLSSAVENGAIAAAAALIFLGTKRGEVWLKTGSGIVLFVEGIRGSRSASNAAQLLNQVPGDTRVKVCPLDSLAGKYLNFKMLQSDGTGKAPLIPVPPPDTPLASKLGRNPFDENFPPPEFRLDTSDLILKSPNPSAPQSFADALKDVCEKHAQTGTPAPTWCQ